MPPFIFIYGEALCFHFAAQQIPHPALLIGATLISGERSLTEFVVSTGHRYLFARSQFVQA